MSASENELDPRIKIELENLNSATDEINKLEIELEEAKSTFRILLNEITRRLKLSSKKLGGCIEKARPYYEALEKAREAQVECQNAVRKFRRATEIHAAAKETVTVAEQRFMSNSHEWEFDNAWQEMLNHATEKVMDAEKQKAECHAEHQQRTRIFHAAEQKLQQLEEKYRRYITKARPYFEEKQICQDQLETQKNRIDELEQQVQLAKLAYANTLRNLESISDDIHRQRGDYPQLLINTPPPGRREPGVGAELNSPNATLAHSSLPDYHLELEKCDYTSIAGSQISLSEHTPQKYSSDGAAALCSSSMLSADKHHYTNAPLAKLATFTGSEHTPEGDGDNDAEDEDDVIIVKSTNSNNLEKLFMEDLDEEERPSDYQENEEGISSSIVSEKDLEALRQKVKFLAVRPIEGGDGQQEQNDVWEDELNATVNELDHLLLLRECAKKQQQEEIKKHNNSNNNRNINNATMRLPSDITCNINRNSIVGDDSVNLSGTTQQVKSKQQSTPLKKLQKLEPLSNVNLSMKELPLLAQLSAEILEKNTTHGIKERRLSLN